MPTDAALPTEEATWDRLRQAWADLLPNQEELGEELLRRYAEPHRRYHTVDHLAFLLDQIDRLSSGQDLFCVRLAAWFHDAVYAIPPGQVSNEEASARLSVRRLSLVGLEQEDLGEVARLVRLTATHRPGARDRNGELLCDADLAVLAGTPEEYADYVAAVRAEYAAVPAAEFAAGRVAVLTDLLAGELFRTGKGRALTARARANVEAEIQALGGSLSQA